MKKILLGTACALVCGCSAVTDIRYLDTVDGGCEYSEVYRQRRTLRDFFGANDSDLKVRYAGVSCQKMVEKELKDETHKKPYNSVPVVNEIPPLKIDISK